MATYKSDTRHTLLVVSLVTLAFGFLWFIWNLSNVLLLVFGAILFAVLLGGIARPLRRGAEAMHWSPPRWLAVVVAAVLVISLLVLGGYSAGPAIAGQLGQLTERLPASLERLREFLGQYGWGQSLVDWADSEWQQASLSAQKVLGGITGVFSTMFGAFSNALLVLILGFYLALQPDVYRGSMLRLLPAERRARVDQVMEATAHALRWWLVGRAISMAVVGVLTGIGLWLIDMPLVLVLAMIAGLLSFVPFLGPVAAAIPAVLVGLMQSPGQALNVVIVYAAVQFLESNIITPYVQVHAVSLPPAVLLGGQLVMGVLFGLLGLLLATPLMVALIVPVQMLYIGDVLGDEVEPLGQGK